MTTNPATTVTTTGALPLTPGRWTLDAAHSTVSFWIRHLGISKVRGTFETFDAVLEVGSSAADTGVTATVDLASVDTSNDERDGHLRSADLLDVATHPQMTFRSTTIAGAGDTWRMEGELTIQGRTRLVSLAVELGGIGEFRGTHKVGFEAHGRIRRQDFLQFSLPPAVETIIGDVINIDLDLQFTAPAGDE